MALVVVGDFPMTVRREIVVVRRSIGVASDR